MRFFLLWLVPLLLALLQVARSQYQTWCGKVYEKQYPAIPPDGAFKIPESKPYQLLYLKVQPRYTIFLENDPSVELIVDAIRSNIFGTPLIDRGSIAVPLSLQTLKILVRCDEARETLNYSSVIIESERNLISFDIKLLSSRIEPYQIIITGHLSDSEKIYSATTEIYILPSRNYGSAVKIDMLYGGSFVQNSVNSYQGWYPIFPNFMYADAKVVIPTIIDFTYLDIYTSVGFNSILIVPDGGAPEQSYNYTTLQKYWDKMDVMNLFNIYSLQFAYQNSTRIETQVNMWKDRSSLFSYHIADEPDGWHHPIGNTKLAYDQIKKLDPYHPIQMTLNCQNFYYAEYAAGADIILEDAYPIATNAHHSVLWDTPCNRTYGDCGIDNGNGVVADIADRLDDLYFYQSHIENGKWKPIWPTIQAFEKQEYWSRQPTSEEVVNMAMISLNHNAKGISYWLYTNPYDVGVAGARKFSTLIDDEEIRNFIFGTMAVQKLHITGYDQIDVSAWVLGDRMMVGLASMSSVDIHGNIEISLPTRTAKGIARFVYGDSLFQLKDNFLYTQGMRGYEVNILILRL
ncbi:putative glycoside hydrolase subgroup catalytic core protein [Golovinomyces cichoracearum]|uniref:Putative glycoside hydrolase subgroup catalytic core protein n=1 Tax=Golovinomyces cichoracearum TaxID=62708 RepID=A0A420HMW7_9PEZI|nr:putative glycoside hydrolase subgroup catalytic core protein [Golovinomyces cichoracearum]